MYMNSLQAGHGSGLPAPQIYSINSMTAKALLDRIKKIRKAIDYRKTKIDILGSQAENASARLAGIPHGSSTDPSPMATAICKKIDLEQEIEDLTTERNSLIAQIDLLENNDLSRLLILRYVQEAPWDDIMAEMGYCHSHIFRMHRTATVQLDALLKDETK